MTRIGINGFGRIGRNFFRAALQKDDVEIVAVNDLAEPEILAHLLKYDSVYGPLANKVEKADGAFLVDGKRVVVSMEREPGKIPWADYGVDLVVESTGFFADAQKAKAHLEAGAKKVLISAPAKGDVFTGVIGVNHLEYDPAKHDIISNGSCTTNGLAPLAKVLNDSFGIDYGLMMTTHAYTSSQSLHDQPMKNLRGARAAAESIVPYSTGAAKAIGKVIPDLEGKLNGLSLRVPVPTVSIVDLTVQLRKEVDVDQVNAALRRAAEGPMKGILGYSEEPLVSSDYRGNTHSSVLDALSTYVAGGRMAKVLGWYDNEWGFCCRLLDMAGFIGSKI